MKGNKAKRRSKRKLLWRDLLKRKLDEVNKAPKKQPVPYSKTFVA